MAQGCRELWERSFAVTPGRTRGILARADAMPFAGRRVVAASGIDRGGHKTAPCIRHGDGEAPTAWRIAGCASASRGHRSWIAAGCVAPHIWDFIATDRTDARPLDRHAVRCVWGIAPIHLYVGPWGRLPCRRAAARRDRRGKRKDPAISRHSCDAD